MAIVEARCPSCGSNIKVEDSQTFGECSHCGNAYKTEKAIAGVQVNNTTIINNYYSNHQSQKTGVQQQSSRRLSKAVGLLLCFFLGLLGAHKFYENKPIVGIIYLFTCGLFGFGAMIDFFVILFTPSDRYCIK